MNTTRTTRTALAALVAAVLAVLAASAPALAHEGSSRPSAQTPAGASWIRAGHFVPGFGTARIDLEPVSGGAEAASIEMTKSAAYGDVTSYLQLKPGTYRATVRDSGATSDSAPLLSRSVTVEKGTARTIAVVGSSKSPRMALLSDDLTPPPAGSSRVRVLAATSRADEVSVKAVDGPTITSGAVLGQTTSYRTVEDGAWRLAVAGGDVRAEESVRLAAGSVYTVVVLDGSTAGVRLRVITDAAGASTMPQGGAATGGGGTAPRDPGADVPLLALLAAGLVAAGLLGVRRAAGAGVRR